MHKRVGTFPQQCLRGFVNKSNKFNSHRQFHSINFLSTNNKPSCKIPIISSSSESILKRFHSDYTHLSDISSINSDDEGDTYLQRTPSSSSVQSKRPTLRVKDILATKVSPVSTGAIFTISESASMEEAITHLVTQKLSSSLVVNSKAEVCGIFTARDVLRHMHKHNNKKSKSNSTLKVSDIMASREKLVFCSPSDTVRRCREIMFQLKIRNMPVIEKGEALGIVTIKDLADSAFNLADTGGKKGFIHNVTGRKGLPEGILLTKDAQDVSQGHSANQIALGVDMATFAMPHPFKTPNGAASDRRNYGANELCSDMSLCEDAHFAIKVRGSLSQPSSSQTYICVADGVGSWRQYGVDPRQFSHKLVENAKKVIESDALQRDLVAGSGFADRGLGLLDQDPIHPLDVILDAWHMTTYEKITGSCTICVATLDTKLNQLSYSNIGDCGLMVLRHIDSETAGYMRQRNVPRHMRQSDLRIAYLSQQQLRSFNLPYQLGFSGISEHKGSFETPSDADTASISVMPGDIVLLASDGLFDNLDLDEIVAEVAEWEKKWFPRGNEEDLHLPSTGGQEALQTLAKDIVLKARELSLDKKRDSPFAILAKENDIMWGGGMPDDTSVVALRIYKSS